MREGTEVRARRAAIGACCFEYLHKIEVVSISI